MKSMAEGTGYIWLDGEQVPWADAKVHVLTHTFHYGMGVFEGVRAYATDTGPAIFRLDDHTRRLFDSAKIMGMEIPYSPEVLNEAQKAIVKDGGLPDAYIRGFHCNIPLFICPVWTARYYPCGSF